MKCATCKAEIDELSAWALVYDNEQYYPFAVHHCEACKPFLSAGPDAYNEGWRKGRSAATEAVRRENRELKERLRITTELLEGKEPRV